MRGLWADLGPEPSAEEIDAARCEAWQNFPPDQYKDELHYLTARYTKAIEDFVRADPTQYLWIHRRWKTRPKDEVPGSVKGVG